MGLVILFMLSFIVGFANGIFIDDIFIGGNKLGTPYHIANSFSYLDEDRFVEMYETNVLQHTFKNKMIYKYVINNLNYKMRKYEEDKDAKTKA